MKRLKKDSKKAVSHIEMAISFAIFVMFVFFMLFYLKPIRNQNISDVLIDAIMNGLENRAKSQLIEIPVNLKVSVAEDCFSIRNPFNTTNTENLFVKDKNSKLLKFTLTGENISIEKSEDFYYIFFSSETFESTVPSFVSCRELNESEYVFGAAKTYELFSISQLESIQQDYINNYDELKNEFRFPVNYDFNIKITLLATKQDLFTMETTKPEKVEVIAREIPIEILNHDGSILNAILNIQVW